MNSNSQQHNNTGRPHARSHSVQQHNTPVSAVSHNSNASTFLTYDNGLVPAAGDGLHPVDLSHEMSASPVSDDKAKIMGYYRQPPPPPPPPPVFSYHPPQASPSAKVEASMPTQVPEEPVAETPRILGMRRTTFLLVLSNTILIIALVLVGVLPSQLDKGQNSGSSPPLTTQTSGSVPSPTICFDTATPPAARSQYGTAKANCPRTPNEQRYTVPGTGLTFARTCGADIKGGDMGRLPTTTMADCLALCAQMNLYPSSGMGTCVGVTWVFGGTQGVGSSHCYPKYNITELGTGNDIESAVLVQ